MKLPNVPNVTINFNYFGCDKPEPPCPESKERIVFQVGPFEEQTTEIIPEGIVPGAPENVVPSPFGEPDMLVKMTNIQKTTVRIKGLKDARGNSIPLDPANTTFDWTTDNTDVLSLTVSDDRLSCAVAAVGPTASASVFLQVETPSGALAGNVQFDITNSAPTSVDLEVDTPVDLDLVQKKNRMAARK